MLQLQPMLRNFYMFSELINNITILQLDHESCLMLPTSSPLLNNIMKSIIKMQQKYNNILHKQKQTKIQKMGNQNSTVQTLNIPILQIKSKQALEQTKYCPPFRKFQNQTIDITTNNLCAKVKIIEPNLQQITVQQEIYTDLQDAFDYRTRSIELNTVLIDQQYVDVRTYLGLNQGQDITLQLKSFYQFNTFNFNNILYEIHMNEEISQLKCKNLNTIQQKYVIQTGLEVQDQELPNTQVYVLSPIATNLSQIIKYRRQNKWPWSTLQFNALALDLSNALSALHAAGFSHNDIRPCNVYYSLQKNCFQLGSFGNAVKFHSKAQRSSMGLSQMRTSRFYGAPELSVSKQANLQQADIYSLGMTLLSAFYLCQPLQYKTVVEYNKEYENKYGVISALKQMIMPIQKRAKISVISKAIPQGEITTRMKNLIQSLQFKNNPKQKELVSSKKLISEGYQRLGLWNQWKDKLYQAYQLEQNYIDNFKKANSISQLARIQFCRGDPLTASKYAKQASKLYRELGYSAYDQASLNESLNFFSKAIECSKYFQTQNDMDNAKSLQGLALIHAEKGQYQISKPLMSQSCNIVIKNYGKNSMDYCKIRMSQAKIQCDFGQFQIADNILYQCLTVSENIAKRNSEQGLKLRAQILHEMGRNAMLQSSYTQNNKQVFLSKAQRCLSQSLLINEKFQDNQIQLAHNYQTFGQIQLRKFNYIGARSHFKKGQQLRQQNKQTNPNSISRLKQKAQTLSNLAACQSGMGNNAQALKNYNQALDIYKNLYGSDHNKYSGIAIGNMSKIYYKLNQIDKSKDCLKLATQILGDLLGDDDPDYQHFKYLEEAV